MQFQTTTPAMILIASETVFSAEKATQLAQALLELKNNENIDASLVAILPEKGIT